MSDTKEQEEAATQCLTQTGVTTAAGVKHERRSGLQIGIRPTLQDLAVQIDGETTVLSVQHGFDVLAFASFANREGQTEQMDFALGRDLSNEGHTPRREWHERERDDVAGWQFGELLLPPILRGGQPCPSAVGHVAC